MQTGESFLQRYRQNEQLPIRIVSPAFGHLPAEQANVFGPVQQRPYYFFLMMLEGSSTHLIDLHHYAVNRGELLFTLPHQVHELPGPHGSNYFKLGFDENCLSLLPAQYPFLINPLNNQKVLFNPRAVARVSAVFNMLLELLSTMNTPPPLILAHLHSLLTEIDAAYFLTGKNPADANLARYIGFKVFVENNLTEHPSIQAIAEHLGLNTNSLYSLVKHYSGLSPKAFITSRLILEARRRIYYGEGTSIKELAYELGYNDPEYFARLFKRSTGKTITRFFQDLSGKH